MWIYPDDVFPEGHKAKVGDIVIASITEFGGTNRVMGVVVETDWDDAVNLMLLDADLDL